MLKIMEFTNWMGS